TARGLPEFAKRLLGVLDDLGIAFGFAHFDQFDIVANARFELAHRLDGNVEFVALAHFYAGTFGIVPEIGRFGLGVQRVEAQVSSIPVKDASSAGSEPARFRRRSFRFPYALHNSLIAASHVAEAPGRINRAGPVWRICAAPYRA